MQEVKKRREASMIERFQRFASKKFYSIRRGYVEVLTQILHVYYHDSTSEKGYFGLSFEVPDDRHRFA